MEISNTIQSDHEDIILDMSYDYYGQRLVTCSSDLKLKVYDYSEENETWILNDSWKV